MMGCRPSANVTWIEEGWCEDPRISEHLLATGEFERDRNVESIGHELTWDIEEKAKTEPAAQAVIN